MTAALGAGQLGCGAGLVGPVLGLAVGPLDVDALAIVGVNKAPHSPAVISRPTVALYNHKEDKNQTEGKAKVVAAGWGTYLNAVLSGQG